MAAAYPAAVKNFSAIINGVTKLVAALFNSPYDEITAIQTELGTNPKGSCADVKTRLDVATDANGYVDQGGLKTTTGEVSTTSADGTRLTLPGGEYGFFPQIKGYITRCVINYAAALYESYITAIHLYSFNTTTVYAQQRYVTASGKDMWIFLLLDKTTKEIISAYQSPDHPAYGNGGDFDKIPHPFNSYDELKHDIVLVDKETYLLIIEKSKETGKSILTLVNEEYKPNIEQEEVYQPLHSGRFINELPELVKTIPNYIKVRKMLVMTEQDKIDKQIAQELKAKEIKDAKQEIKNNVKLKLDLTDEDLDNLKKAL